LFNLFIHLFDTHRHLVILYFYFRRVSRHTLELLKDLSKLGIELLYEEFFAVRENGNSFLNFIVLRIKSSLENSQTFLLRGELKLHMRVLSVHVLNLVQKARMSLLPLGLNLEKPLVYLVEHCRHLLVLEQGELYFVDS